ncbi:MAG: hypothetical protein AAGI67_20920, partial [Pseudomonadota bacterium]
MTTDSVGFLMGYVLAFGFLILNIDTFKLINNQGGLDLSHRPIVERTAMMDQSTETAPEKTLDQQWSED